MHAACSDAGRGAEGARVPARTVLGILVALAIALPACHGHVQYVAVPEARFRSEETRDQRLALPLDAAARARLEAYLEAGGDTDNLGRSIADPGARDHYRALLDRLSGPEAIALAELTEGRAYRAWFKNDPLRQVVDAREPSPPAIDPVAVSDGHYWWIFYPHHKRLGALMVVRAVPEVSPK